MKRIAFIKIGGIGLLTLLINPWKALGSMNVNRAPISLKAPVQQIRHGLMIGQFQQLTPVSNWLSFGEPQRFFKNGYHAGTGDLITLPLGVNGNTQNLYFKSKHTGYSNIEPLNNLLTNKRLEYNNIKVINLKPSEEFNIKTDGVLLALEGTIISNELSLKSWQAIECAQGQNWRASTSATLLLIQQ